MKLKIENLAILIGFPLLWLATGIFLLVRYYLFTGGLFIAGAIAMAILVGLLHRKKRLDFPKSISTRERIGFTIAAIASVGFGMASPYIIMLFSR